VKRLLLFGQKKSYNRSIGHEYIKKLMVVLGDPDK